MGKAGIGAPQLLFIGKMKFIAKCQSWNYNCYRWLTYCDWQDETCTGYSRYI